MVFCFVGKSSHGNKVTLERVISHMNVDMCKCLLNFESMFRYFMGDLIVLHICYGKLKCKI